MKPETRKEAYLAAIGGQDVDVPAKPITREEAYLAAILKNGLGAKNLEDLADVQIVDPVNGYVVKYDAVLEKWVAGPASGSGGTSDYTDLVNKPQINGHTLAGDKSAEDLGLAESDDIPTKVSELENDVDFIADADYVHTDNNYDDNAKGIVNGVTEALAGKQDELTFDNIPTENSTNPVKSGGVYSADEAIRQWTTAEAKSVSGNPITLTDGSARNAEGLSVTCNPKQNLHGYDHPWAGGAGKNKLPLVLADIKSANTGGTWNGNVYTLADMTFTVETDADGNVTDIKLNGTSSADWVRFNIASYTQKAGSYIVNGVTGGTDSTYRMEITGKSGTITNGDYSYTINEDTATVCYIIIRTSGTVCNNVKIYPMVRLSTVSDATFEPYTNICPITGYTECVVDDHGENMFDPSTYETFDLSGQGAYRYGHSYPSGNYYLSAKENNKIFYRVVKADLSDLGTTVPVTTTVQNVIVSNGYVLWVFSAETAQSVLSNGCVSGKNTTYVPYTAHNATITFGQTVYGGSVDFKTGKVTVTKVNIDLGALTWTSATTGTVDVYRMYATLSENLAKIITSVDVPNAICEIYKAITAHATHARNTGFFISNNQLLIYDPDYDAYDSPTAFKTAMDGVHLCYELETPIELTLTPAELELLKGYNYITSNGTTIALDYLPDSLLAEMENYVDAKIPPAPSSDGTYVLTCTVTSGTPAYTWESAT